MKLDQFTKQMENTAEIIRQMVEGISDEQARWKPTPEAWSILEVINHLYDEEREDFRARLDVMLNGPGDDMPPWNPVGAVTERRYNERDVAESLNNYLSERKASLAWLRGLESPDWDASFTLRWGEMTAGDMFASWMVHDLLHMRQLTKLMGLYSVRELDPYKIDYSGGSF